MPNDPETWGFRARIRGKWIDPSADKPAALTCRFMALHHAKRMTKTAQPPGPKPRPCSEIPTAVMEPDPFLDDDNNTFIDDPTQELTPMTDRQGATPSPSPSPSPSPNLEKFRRPTRSEIRDAVDQVNTEPVDLSDVAQAQAEQVDTDEF